MSNNLSYLKYINSVMATNKFVLLNNIENENLEDNMKQFSKKDY